MATSPAPRDDDAQSRVRDMRRVAVVVFASAIALLVTVLVGLMRAPPPPVIEREPPAGKPLASHVLLILVDGLRYQDAIDEARMPSFARHMRTDTHGLLWAGRITMTSAAVLTIGTGISGDFAQVVTNVDAGRTQENELFSEARARGMHTGLIGDDTWVKLYGAFDQQVAHEHELALGADNSEAMINAAAALLAKPDRPEIIVTHFVTPDSVGHAVGAGTAAYYDVLSRFDQRLGAFLDALPADETVIAISDHGMKANGTHGADSVVERSSPLFARGPGIRPGADLVKVEQIDLTSTLAALLGLSVPNGAAGTTMVEMLDITPSQAADLVCADANRVSRLEKKSGLDAELSRASADLATCKGGDFVLRLAAGRRVVRAYQTAREEALATAGFAGTWLSFAILAALLYVAASVGARHSHPTFRAIDLVPALVASVVVVGLVYGVDRITPPWHNVVRGIVYVVANVPLAWMLLAPAKTESFTAKHTPVALAAVPFVLALTFSNRLQMEAWIFLVVAFLLLASIEGGLVPARLRFPPAALSAAFVVSLALLFPAAKYVDLVDALSLPAPRSALCAHAAMALWLVGGARIRDGRLRAVPLVLAVALSSGFLSIAHLVPLWLGATLAIGSALAAARLFTTQRTLACGLFLASYGLVGRELEIVPLVGAAMTAEVLAVVSAPALERGELLRRPWVLAVTAGALFALLFLVRVTAQGGIDFVTIDWAAGTFAELRVTAWYAVAANAWKYLVSGAFVLWLAVGGASREDKPILIGAVALLFALRSASLAWELFVCRSSYFTAFHAFGDLPGALFYAAVFAAMLAAASRVKVT